MNVPSLARTTLGGGMKPLIAALAVIAVAVLVALAVRPEDPSGEPRTPETFQRVSVLPLETTIELTR
jgi:hypothetical protein